MKEIIEAKSFNHAIQSRGNGDEELTSKKDFNLQREVESRLNNKMESVKEEVKDDVSKSIPDDE